ncbi:MAG: nucleotidyltransferase family protein [Nanoarchaeota archaeon]|nr:nucleotidyltransferase family protein [Nanoarchaeota archaeon]MBU1621988.1 nucleotidyltransferase family protein [Nanoarchaeota archaeon]
MIKSQKLKQIAKMAIPILKKNGVVRAGIFGSYARGEQKKKSDVDLLVKLKGRKSLLDVVRLERELKEVLGKKVDLLTYQAISPYLKEQILREEVRII